MTRTTESIKTCGEVGGHRTKSGALCRYRVGAGLKGCPHHTLDADGKPKAREFQQLGTVMSKLRHALPEDTPLPELDTLDGLEQAAKFLFKLALTRNIERWRLSEARGAVDLLLKAQQVRVEEQLYLELVRIERGGVAAMYLTQMRESARQGKSRPLPGIPGRPAIAPGPEATPDADGNGEGKPEEGATPVDLEW